MKEVTIKSKIVGRGGASAATSPGKGVSVDMSSYLLKQIWEKVFEFRLTDDGTEYLFAKMDLAVQGGVTMYANGGNLNLKGIYDGLPIDNDTIYWDGTVLRSRGVGEGGVTPTLLGDLKNVGAWANAIATEDRIMVQKKDSSSWEALELSKIGGSASFENVKESGAGNAYTSFILSEDKKSLTFLKEKVFAEKSNSLSGYGIADAKIANGVITLGNNTITPLTQVLGDARYVTALGASGNDLTWTKNGVVNKFTVSYATHSAHTSYLKNYLGDYSSITDLNEPSTFKTSQYRVVYDFYDGNTANRPVTSNNASGVLTLFKGIHRTGGGQYMSQMAFPDKDAVYFRRASDGVFGDWKQFAFTDSDITGNAGTATALKDRRSLWGQWFDGKDNVSGDMTGVGSVAMDGQLSLNGITIKKSADGVLFVDGNLVVSGGVTMYGTDGTTANTIWDDAPIANTNGKKGVASYDQNFFAVNNGVVTFVGQIGGGIESITKQMVIDALGYTPYSSANPNGYITGINKSDVTNALGYTPYDASNPNNYVTSSGTVANATNLTSYKAVTLTKSDNGGKPCYLLIADVTSWYSASASVYDWGIAGIMYGWRAGNLSGTCVQKMIAMCSYNKSYYELRSDVITYVKPRIVSYGGKYYIALYMAGSGRSHYFIGKTSRLLDDFIEVACDSNGNCDGLVVVFDTEVMAMGGASVGKLTTKRKIWGQDFDGTEDVSGAITGATTGSFSGNVSMGSATINGGNLTYDSTNKYWKLEGDLLVTGGVTMFGNDSSFSPSTITQAVNVDGTTIINDGKKLMVNPDIQLGGGGVTDYNDLTNKPDLSVYALKTSLSSYQTKITSSNKLDYGLISGTPTIPTNTNQLTNGAGFITSSGSITGNAATATTASKLSTVSKSAWGKTYWTSGGVPTDINGDMSSVGNIISSANNSYELGSSDNKWKNVHANCLSFGNEVMARLTTKGWYRFAVGGDENDYGGSFIFFIRRGYNTVATESFVVSATVGYARVVFNQLSGAVSGSLITKVRATNYSDGKIYFDLYYEGSTIAHAVYINAVGDVTVQAPTSVSSAYSFTTEFSLSNGMVAGKSITCFDYKNLAFIRQKIGKNLLPNGDNLINTNAYAFGEYIYDESVVNGRTYRLTICGKLGDENTHIAAYWDGGSGNNTTITGLSSKEERIVSITAKITNKNVLRFYQFPSDKYGSYIRWAYLEEAYKEGELSTTTDYNNWLAEYEKLDTRSFLYKIQRIDVGENSYWSADKGLNLIDANAYALTMKGTSSDEGTYIKMMANNQTSKYWAEGVDSSHQFSWRYMDGSSELEKMKLDNTGNLISTYWKLSNSSTNPYLKLTQGSTWYIQGYNGYLYLGAGRAKSMRIDSSGNVLTVGGITMYSDLRKKTILNHVELSLKEVADAPLIEHYYNSDEAKTTHVGSVAQYWARLNDWFCKEDEEGYLTMEIQNAALASAISVARELTRYESKTDKQIKKLKKRIGELEEEIENLKKM